MTSSLGLWQRAALDVLFPPACVACGALGREPFCPPCASSVESPSPGSIPSLPAVDWSAALWAYGGAVAVAIARLKYRDGVEVARPLGRALQTEVRGFKLDCLVPMPLNEARLRARGYNQARELARDWATPVARAALRRRDDRPNQVGQTMIERQANLCGAFTAERRYVEGRRILLIDDVVTTGATAQAAASALKSANARWVGLLVVATTCLRDPRIDIVV